MRRLLWWQAERTGVNVAHKNRPGEWSLSELSFSEASSPTLAQISRELNQDSDRGTRGARTFAEKQL